jgi:hypothetical protein
MLAVDPILAAQFASGVTEQKVRIKHRHLLSAG